MKKGCWKYNTTTLNYEHSQNQGATTECRATLDHLFYMCQNLFKNEAEHSRHYCD